jgi:hypothetical protein
VQTLTFWVWTGEEFEAATAMEIGAVATLVEYTMPQVEENGQLTLQSLHRAV